MTSVGVELLASGLGVALLLTAAALLAKQHVHALGVRVNRLAPGRLVGSLPGIHLGSAVGTRVPEPVLRGIFAGVVLPLGVRFLS